MYSCMPILFCFQVKLAIDQDLFQDTNLVRLRKTFLERLEICTEDAININGVLRISVAASRINWGLAGE